MANESTSSTLSELYTEIVAEAQFVAQEQSIMRNLVRNYAITGGGKAVEVPIYAAVSAAAVSEATDCRNSYWPEFSNYYCIWSWCYDYSNRFSKKCAPRNVAADIGRLFGEAVAKNKTKT